LEDKGNAARMHTPLDQLDLIVQRPAKRARKTELAKPTRTTQPFLFKKGKICEITGALLVTRDSVITNHPRLKTAQEVLEILGVTNLHFLRRGDIFTQVKQLFRNLIENRDFSKKEALAVSQRCLAKFKGEVKLTIRFYYQTQE
jgi:hypothetical protein